MRPDPSLIIRTAELPGDPNRPSEDRIFTTPNAAIVLDGASQYFPLERSGGWIADELGRRLQKLLLKNPLRDLTDTLDQAVRELIATYDLRRGEAPSTTVNIVRSTGDELDVLVLCDSPVVVLDTSGEIDQIRDDRLSDTHKRLRHISGSSTSTDRFVERFESLRNHPEGFWCVSADPAVAQHALVRDLSLASVSSALAVTDGVSTGVDRYGIPQSWTQAFKMGTSEPHALIDLIHKAEARDFLCTLWPRRKVHDDKSICLIQGSQP